MFLCQALHIQLEQSNVSDKQVYDILALLSRIEHAEQQATILQMIILIASYSLRKSKFLLLSQELYFATIMQMLKNEIYQKDKFCIIAIVNSYSARQCIHDCLTQKLHEVYCVLLIQCIAKLESFCSLCNLNYSICFHN